MRRELFSDASPGKLVPTTLWRWRTTPKGIPEAEEIPALAFSPDPLPPALDWRSIKADLFDELTAATAALFRVNGLVPLAPNSGVLRHALWLREAKLSSAIEDIHTTALDMVLAETRQSRGEDNPGLEALNAMKAVRHALESDLPFSGRLIREMHRVLLRGVRGEDKHPGEYRGVQAYIGPAENPGRARFIPPPPGTMPGQVDPCMAELEKFANADHPEIPGLAAVAMIHYQFEAIHPFRDGNGRVGRALILHQLCRRGLLDLPVVFVSGYFQQHKQSYVDRLFAVSAEGDWLGWIRFFVEAVATQAAQTRVLAERLIGMHRRFTERVRDDGAPARLMTLVDSLFEWPVVNARSVAGRLGVTDPTARSDLSRLERLGILELTDDVSYGKAWYPPEIIRVIETPVEELGGDPHETHASEPEG